MAAEPDALNREGDRVRLTPTVQWTAAGLLIGAIGISWCGRTCFPWPVQKLLTMPILKNRRHEAFAQQLAQGVTTEAAYQAAGYKPDRGNASRLTANDSIRARVAELQEKIAEAVIEKTAIDEARVIEELARIAFSDITKAVQWRQEQSETIDQAEDGSVTTIVRTIQNRVLVTPSDKIDADTAAAVASVTLTASGTLAVKMHDKIAALRALSDRFRQSEVAPQQFNPNVPFIDAPPRETREEWIARQAQRREDGKMAPQ